MRRLVTAAPPGCEVEITDNVSHDELAKLCCKAAAKCYLWAPIGFHHKLLEVLVNRRPASSFAGERFAKTILPS